MALVSTVSPIALAHTIDQFWERALVLIWRWPLVARANVPTAIVMAMMRRLAALQSVVLSLLLRAELLSANRLFPGR